MGANTTARHCSQSNAGFDALFHPSSVALIGLSSDAGKMTGAPLAILQRTSFAGEIYPVNPKVSEIGGYRCYPDVQSLPEGIDVAMIMLPARRCVDAVRDCASKGIRGVVIVSSGFEETEAGHQYAKDLKRIADETGMAVVGPNCEGLWSVSNRSLLTFGTAAKRDVVHHAPIAVLSQSGAIAGAVARHLQDDGVGCSYVVSVGNETVLTISDYLEWMIEQDDVKVVLLFIEGLRDGARLLNLIRRAVGRGIRVAALKSGNSPAGVEAAASHTGKIASSYAVYHDLLVESGAVLVQSLTELIVAGEVLGTARLPLRRPEPADGGRNGVAVFSIPGGSRAHTVDQCDLHGVPLSVFSRETVAALTDALPEFGGVENPTDLTGQVLSYKGLFDEVLTIIARDPHTEALIVQVANRGPRDIMDRIALLEDVAQTTGVPVFATFLGDALPAQDRALLRSAGVHCARDPAEAARLLGWLYRAREASERVQDNLDVARLPSLPAPVGWVNCAKWLETTGIALPAWRLLGPLDDPASVCSALSYPMAIKALPEDSDHKTEQGLLALSLRTADEVKRQAARIRQAMDKPDSILLVQEMVDAEVEVLLAGVINPDFGPVLAIGLGGVAVELFQDVAWLALPTDSGRVQQAISRLRLATMLAGFRGHPPADQNALVEAIVKFGDCFIATDPPVAEMEINPLLVRAAGLGVVAVDMLVKVD